MGRHNHNNDNSFVRGNTTIDFQVQRAVEELRRKGEHVLTAAKSALRDGANIILSDMKANVPVRSGRLKSSIKAESLENGAIYQFSADARNPKDNFLYAPIVEFSEWVIVRGKKHKKKKQAFMYPAFEKNQTLINSMVKNAINSAIERGA